MAAASRRLHNAIGPLPAQMPGLQLASMNCHIALQRHKGISKKIEIPRSVPGLVTRRLLVMNFLDGLQITRLGDKTKNLSRKKRKVAVERIVHRVAEAYGRQLLYGGLFQADGHPGNILVMKGTHICLLC